MVKDHFLHEKIHWRIWRYFFHENSFDSPTNWLEILTSWKRSSWNNLETRLAMWVMVYCLQVFYSHLNIFFLWASFKSFQRKFKQKIKKFLIHKITMQYIILHRWFKDRFYNILKHTLRMASTRIRYINIYYVHKKYRTSWVIREDASTFQGIIAS